MVIIVLFSKQIITTSSSSCITNRLLLLLIHIVSSVALVSIASSTYAEGSQSSFLGSKPTFIKKTTTMKLLPESVVENTTTNDDILKGCIRGGGGGNGNGDGDETDDDTTFASMSSVASPTSSIVITKTIWDTVKAGPPDIILGIAQKYRESDDGRKVNLVIGAYRDSNGLPWILPSVRCAEQKLVQLSQSNPTLYNHEYLPIEGDGQYVQSALAFAYGTELVSQLRIVAVQSLSGTGACRIIGQFLSNHYGNKNIYIPIPTWMNHYKIFDNCNLITNSYRYYDDTNHCLNFHGLIEDLNAAPDKSIILLHACAHNPTGCDPTLDEWEQILQVIQKKQHLPFFDCAYQGFATGDAEYDAQVIRLFGTAIVNGSLPQGMVLAQSFAKNFGLYGDRVGCASIVLGPKTLSSSLSSASFNDDTEEETTTLVEAASTAAKAVDDAVLSQLKQIIRPMYSSPPKHGSDIVKTILQDDTLRGQYYTECQFMSNRIKDMRINLVKLLHELQQNNENGSSTTTPPTTLQKDWSYIADKQIGMFAYTGLTPEQVDALTTKYSIYLTRDGRVSLAGLNESNLQYVAQAIHDVTTTTTST